MTESEKPMGKPAEPDGDKSRIHYIRGQFSVLLRATEGPSCDSVEVTVPTLLATDGSEASYLAAYQKMHDFYLRTITPDSVNPDRLKKSSTQEDG